VTLHPTAILHVLADTADALRWAYEDEHGNRDGIDRPQERRTDGQRRLCWTCRKDKK